MDEYVRKIQQPGNRFEIWVLPEIRNGLKAEVVRVTSRAIDEAMVGETEGKVRLRDTNQTKLVNAVLAGFFTLPPEERNQIIERGQRQCHRLQQSRRIINFDPAGSVPGICGELPKVGREGLPGYRQSPRKRRDRGEGQDPTAPGANHAPGR